jgi:hypothetical protein
MGRFGIEFSDKTNTPFKINKKKYYASVINSRENLAPDTVFQRGLAWASYFVLVFVAFCVFNKPAVAGVIQTSSAYWIVDLKEEGKPIHVGQWTLRPTVTEPYPL